jgi:hypothetical protein
MPYWASISYHIYCSLTVHISVCHAVLYKTTLSSTSSTVHKHLHYYTVAVSRKSSTHFLQHWWCKLTILYYIPALCTDTHIILNSFPFGDCASHVPGQNSLFLEVQYVWTLNSETIMFSISCWQLYNQSYSLHYSKQHKQSCRHYSISCFMWHSRICYPLKNCCYWIQIIISSCAVSLF